MQRVGFDRTIKIEWLDKVVELYKNEKEVKKIKNELYEFLIDKVICEDNRRKCVNILIYTWVEVPKEYQDIRDKALVLFDNATDKERLFMHWFMLMLAFPIFNDIIDLIGKLLSIQDEFSLSTIKQRIFELWGERSTVKYAVEKIIASMVQWKVLERQSKPGMYKKAPLIEIKNADIKLLFIECYLKSSKRPYINYYELNSLYKVFPFKITINLQDFYKSDMLNLNKMGDSVVIAI